MAVRVTKRADRAWLVTVHGRRPDGSRLKRDRRVVKGLSREQAKTWGEQRLAALLAPSPTVPKPTPPTLAEFSVRYLAHCALRQTPSTVTTKASAFDQHLLPALGPLPLDRIDSAAIAGLQDALATAPGRPGRLRSPKTVNNVTLALQGALRTACEWGLIPAVPRIVPLKHKQAPMVAYDIAELERLLATAQGPERLVVLLGAEAGLRSGEITGLEWGDVDLAQGMLTVRRSEWRGQVGPTKSGRDRKVPLSDRLASELAEFPRLGPRVLYRGNGTPPGASAGSGILRSWIAAAERRAGMPVTRKLHVLRHTFCSTLAARGAPVHFIRELAGHGSLSVTQKYMHSTPAGLRDAIDLLGTIPAPVMPVTDGTPDACEGGSTARL